MKSRLFAASAAAVLMLSACGGKDDNSSGSKNVDKAVSPIEQSFKLDNAKPLDVNAFFTMLNEGEEYDEFSFDSTSFDDKTGATIITNLKSTDDEETLKVGRVELYGVNDTYIEALIDGNVSATQDSLFRKIRLFDVSIVDSVQEDIPSVTIGAMEIDGLKFGGFNKDEFKEAEEPAQMATAAKAFELGGIYFTDLNISGMEVEGSGIDLKAKDFRIGKIANGSIGKMLMKDMEYTIRQSPEAKQALLEDADPQMAAILAGPLGNIIMPEEQRITVGMVSWDGMGISGLLPFLEKGEEPGLDAKNLISVGKAVSKDTVVYVNGKKAAVTEYSEMEPIEFSWFVPTKIKTFSKGTTLDLSAYVPEDQTEIMGIIKENGLDNITGDGEFLWSYDEKSGDAEFVYDANLKGFANFDMRFKSSGAVLETLYNGIKSEDPSSFMSVALNNFSFKIEDDKFLDTMFDVAGLQMGQDGDQLRAGMPMMVQMGGAQFAELSPRIPSYLEALSAWIGEGGTIEIKVAPEAPVTFMELGMKSQMAPQDLPDALNLTVTRSE